MISAKPCPYCQKTDAQNITFTWWGGLIGPKMFHHVRCLQCGKTYNAKTGRSNTTAIIIYQLVGLLIVLALLAALVASGFFG